MTFNDNHDRLIIPDTNEVIPDEMAGAPDIDGPPDMIPPLALVAPLPLPVAIDIDVFHGDDGTGYVALRCEHTHGSNVFFLMPDVAEALAAKLFDAAPGARVQLHRPTDN